MLTALRSAAAGALEFGQALEGWVERELADGRPAPGDGEEGARALQRFETDQVLQYIESDDYELLGKAAKPALTAACDRYVSLCFKLDHQEQQLGHLAGDLREALGQLRQRATAGSRSDQNTKELRIRVVNLRLDVTERKDRRRINEAERQELYAEVIKLISEAKLELYLDRIASRQIDFPDTVKAQEGSAGWTGMGGGTESRGGKGGAEAGTVSGRAGKLRSRIIRRKQTKISDEELTSLLSESI